MLEKLGAGSYGVVWRAHDQLTGRAVALKTLHARTLSRPRALERFAREADILTRLRHDNLAATLACASYQGTAYLAMELVPGVELDRVLEQRANANAPLALEEVAHLVRQLFDVLGYVHERGVVHRDLKPSNIMIDLGTLNIRVLDFGIAKLVGRDQSDQTTVGRVLGSILYMSPEQFKGEPIDGRSDVFALGSILFELLTLRKAWAKNDEGDPLELGSGHQVDSNVNTFATVMRRICREERPKPSAYRAGLSSELDEISRRSMAIAAAQRYENIDSFRRALEPFLPAPPDETLPARRRAIDALPLVLSVALGVGTLLLLLGRSGSNDEMVTATTPKSEPAERIEARPGTRHEAPVSPAPTEPRAADGGEERPPEPPRPRAREVPRRSASRAAKAEAPPAPAHSITMELRTQLDRLKANPKDARLARELGEMIQAEARRVGGARGREIEKRALYGAATLSATELSKCIDRLEAAHSTE